MPKIKYDKQAGALYIYVLEGLEHGKTEELIPDTVILDKSKLGQITGIEILGIENIEDLSKE